MSIPRQVPAANSLPALVLCVDDDLEVLQSLEALLGDAGYDVMVAESGERALRVISTVRPDLLLLDVGMADLDGYAVCAKLQESKELSYLPVVLLGASDAPIDTTRAVALGAVECLTKPVADDDLLEKVAAHVKTNAWFRDLERQKATPKTGASSNVTRFKQHLADALGLAPAQAQRLTQLAPLELYGVAEELGATPAKIAEELAAFLELPYRGRLQADAIALGVLPVPFCKANHVAAMRDAAGSRSFVLSDPLNWELQQILRRVGGAGGKLEIGVTEPANIAAVFDGAAAGQATPGAAAVMEADNGAIAMPAPVEVAVAAAADERSGPVIRLVNQLIENAHAMGASDIHVEPRESEVVVRYRVDGNMRVVNRFPQARLIHPLVSRIKIMAQLDIVERRLPQDGRIAFKKFSSKGLDVDLRVATAPMHHGEKVVMRILDKKKAVLPLTDLGFSPRHLKLYHEKLATPYGMILHVGPTGSGKSMTLYAALNEIQRPDLNIQTAEDPIEYTLPGINQMQVNREIGLTFQRALRSYLRQDPDVILVGEIRDLETAEIAVEAALTGHVLLSTLHTNDATSTIVRLVEMGIEPFMVSSSLVLVCAQRLLRRLCRECREAYEPDAQERLLVGVDPGTPLTLYRGRGCGRCNDIGFRGRIGTHEICVPDDAMRKVIATKGATAEALKRMAVETCDMTTLYWDAMEKVRAGVCALDDVLTEVRRDEFDSRPAWMFEELGLTRPGSRDVPPS
ncbi:MAG: Flp pilus assembly complex ATPase component TadA [Deltaproteobacteria bacterium]|nr:Flp pilus assembly complex ATPase component TadA [Deltaproteobacteria bacterium]